MIIRHLTKTIRMCGNQCSEIKNGKVGNSWPCIRKSNTRQQHSFLLPSYIRNVAHLSTENCDQVTRESTINDFDKCLNSTQSCNELTLSLLQQLFDFPGSKKAEKIMYKYAQFQTVHPDAVKNTYRFLIERGVTSDRLLKIPWLLTIDRKILEEKVQILMTKLRIEEFLCAISFLRISSYQLTRISSLWETELLYLTNQSFYAPEMSTFQNRIEILSFWLQCECYKAADMMVKSPILMSSPLKILDKKISMMLDHGILASDIIRDPFIFTNLLSSIEAKLIICKQHGLTTIKPWMLRCTSTAFESYVARINHEQQLLHGHKDNVSFLSNSLGCTSAITRDILVRVPSIRNASAIKLNEMIQFLFTQGFTLDQILEAPRILGHSVETVEKRIIELDSYEFTLNSLHILCETTKRFRAFIRKLGKASSEEEKAENKFT